MRALFYCFVRLPTPREEDNMKESLIKETNYGI